MSRPTYCLIEKIVLSQQNIYLISRLNNQQKFGVILAKFGLFQQKFCEPLKFWLINIRKFVRATKHLVAMQSISNQHNFVVSQPN